MCKYLVTFEWNKQAEEKITEVISSYKSLQVFWNSWFLESDKTAFNIWNEFKDFIWNDEKIFITEVSKNRDCWLNITAWDFLNN